MKIQNKLLFAADTPIELGLGFHNIGDVLRYGNADVVKYLNKHYGQRCGHIPLTANQIGILVEQKDDEITSQITYLSSLFGREIKIMTPDEVKKVAKKQATLIVPYTNLPETETFIEALGGKSWGLPGNMSHLLKNKSEFHKLVDGVGLDEFQSPSPFVIANIDDVVEKSKKLLKKISDLYDQTGLSNDYPLGVVLRASDEHGNYGAALVYEKNKSIIVVPNGDAEHIKTYTGWQEALTFAQQVIAEAIDHEKEPHVVIDRYIDSIDSPGMSIIMLDGETYSLGWNGQFMDEGGIACKGTHSYTPKTKELKNFQKEYEAKTAEIFAAFLKNTAKQCGIDFTTIRGIANIDMLIPSEIEKKFQEKIGQQHTFYVTECNERWTNYTDAISTVLGAERREQTANEMMKVIRNGIWTYDKYKLPAGIDPKIVRELIFEKDQQLQKEGTRIICRMAKNPMGLIFAGDFKRAEQAIANIIHTLVKST